MVHDNDGDDHRDQPVLVDRRKILAASGVAAGALWVAPSVLSFTAAAAASALATVTPGTVVHIPGNNSTTVPLPSGTFTEYLLIIAEVTTGSGNGTLPVLSAGSGFTVVGTDSASPPPNFIIYQSAAGTSAPILTGNDTKGRWTAVVLGFTVGTTVTASPIASAAASPISVASTTPRSTRPGCSSAAHPTAPVPPTGRPRVATPRSSMSMAAARPRRTCSSRSTTP